MMIFKSHISIQEFPTKTLIIKSLLTTTLSHDTIT